MIYVIAWTIDGKTQDKFYELSEWSPYPGVILTNSRREAFGRLREDLKEKASRSKLPLSRLRAGLHIVRIGEPSVRKLVRVKVANCI